MNQSPPDIKTIFGKALEIDSDDARAAFLDAACAGNEPLRAEVVSLLEASDQAGSFLAAPAVGLPAPPAGQEEGAKGVATVD
ncbi:MAG: hypothetical protein ACM3U2_16185, partial [Deltaproteobacteria bacterium]